MKGCDILLPSRIFFNSFFDDFDSPRKLDKMMSCDIYEEEENYILEIDVPGFKKEDINLEVEEGYLKVVAEKNIETDDSDSKKYLHRERNCMTRCERQFYIGDVSAEDIKAKFSNGSLKILVPKTEDRKVTKQIITIED